MSFSINKVQLGGNLVRDPEMRYTPGGAAMLEFTIACNDKWTDKQTGQKKEKVTFVSVKAWGKTAEFAAEQLRKGDRVYVEGSLDQEKWETPEGQKREKTKVKADRVHILDWHTDGQKGGVKKEPLVVPDDQGQDEQVGGDL